MIPDLEYYRLKYDMFTLFLPNTKKGVVAWRELAKHTEGTGKVATIHEKIIINKLKAAGYTVEAGKPPADIELEELEIFMKECENN